MAVSGILRFLVATPQKQIPIIQEFVLGPRALQRGLFESSLLRRLAEEHLAGKGEHGDRLWLLVNLEIWQRIFLDGEDMATVMRAV